MNTSCDERVLVLALTAGDATLSQRILSEAGFTCHHCADLPALCQEVEAGAGAILHALADGRTPVLMPRRARYDEHVDDHQAELALHLARLGRVVVAWEPADLAGAVRLVLGLGTRESSSAPEGLIQVVSRCLDEALGARS